MLEFTRRYAVEVLKDANDYAEHAGTAVSLNLSFILGRKAEH